MEIDLFWKRSSHYWVFVGAALVAYGALRKDHPGMGLLISCFGVVASYAWVLSNVGSKWWIENWETKLKREAVAVESVDLLTPERKIANPSWFAPAIRYSVTRPTIILSEFITFFWLGIFAKESLSRWVPSFPDVWRYRESAACIATATTIVLLLLSKGKDRSTQST